MLKKRIFERKEVKKRMHKEVYKKRIIEMMDKIEDESVLKRIYGIVHRYFIMR